MASQLKINVVLMKELLKEAEIKGHLCRDERMEGVRYYENLILKWVHRIINNCYNINILSLKWLHPKDQVLLKLM
jgi:hypothetical protein